jgi:hypothetical protein
MSAWYYCLNGHQHGPIAFDELKDMVRRGELVDTSRIWKIGTTEWVRVGKQPELVSLIPTTQRPAAWSPWSFGSFLNLIPETLRFPKSSEHPKTSD